MNEYIEIVNNNLMYHKSDGAVIKLLPTIEDIMSADSVDRPQGEWINKGDYAECSNCGADSGTQFDGVEPIPLTTKFCPNCGVRMKGADDE